MTFAEANEKAMVLAGFSKKDAKQRIRHANALFPNTFANKPIVLKPGATEDGFVNDLARSYKRVLGDPELKRMAIQFLDAELAKTSRSN